jgi:hypothetical protein
MKMQKKSYYVEDEQIRKLQALSSVCPGQPQISSLIREGIDLVVAKYFEMDFVKQALAKRQKKAVQIRRIRSVS